MKNYFSLLLIIGGFLSYPLNAQLSKTEKKLIQSVDQHNEDARSMLIELVNINSGSMNFDGVKRVGDILIEEFQEIGMETEWIDGSSFGRSGHLVARQRGTGPKILLIGHLDTVFELESEFQKATLVNDSTLRGPGTCDMKGGDVIILKALSALDEIGKLKDMNLVVVMTGDEELSGKPLNLARKILLDEAQDAQYVLGFENGDGDPTTALVSRRGYADWKLSVEGTPSHSSQLFSDRVGSGAIYETSRILHAFHEELSGEKYLTYNPGLILGGTLVKYDEKLKSGYASGKSNVVSKEVIVTGDIRTISQEQYEATCQKMLDIVGKNFPNTSASIEFVEGYPSLAPTDGNKKLLEYYSSASEDLGYGKVLAVDPMKAGAADVSFASGLSPMIIDGLGLSGTHGHTDSETADLRFLPIQTKRAAVLLYRLTYQYD